MNLIEAFQRYEHAIHRHVNAERKDIPTGTNITVARLSYARKDLIHCIACEIEARITKRLGGDG